MTIKKLIELLSKYDNDKMVTIYNDDKEKEMSIDSFEDYIDGELCIHIS